MHDLCTFKTQCHEKKSGCITFLTPLVYFLDLVIVLILFLSKKIEILFVRFTHAFTVDIFLLEHV